MLFRCAIRIHCAKFWQCICTDQLCAAVSCAVDRTSCTSSVPWCVVQFGFVLRVLQSRSFAQISLPRAGNPCLCAITGIAPALQVLVATSEGILYEFRLDAESGGDCERLAGYPLCSSATNLLDMSESRGAASAGTAGDGDDSASPGTAEGATATEPTEPAPDAAAAAP